MKCALSQKSSLSAMCSSGYEAFGTRRAGRNVFDLEG